MRAYSKITWTLNVLGRFPRGHINFGYTNVEIGLALINLYDEINIDVFNTKNKQIIINCDNPKIPQTKNGDAQKNICFQAIVEMRKVIPNFCDNDIEINIKKNIPLAGGLGGSSTDGVAVIKGLNQILKLNLSRQDIMDISARIGSDTVFFASDYKVALASGRGEIIEELNNFTEKPWLILVNPNVETITRDTCKKLADINYKNCNIQIQNLSYSQYYKRLLNQKTSLSELTKCLYNDYEKSPATLQKHPILLDIKDKLKQNGCLGALMSGAGSTIFGICESKNQAKNIAQKISKIYPQFQVLVTRTL